MTTREQAQRWVRAWRGVGSRLAHTLAVWRRAAMAHDNPQAKAAAIRMATRAEVRLDRARRHSAAAFARFAVIESQTLVIPEWFAEREELA